MRSEIILIGPMKTGKSTIGRLLSDRLGIPQESLDMHRWRYYKEQGYQPELARQYMEEGNPDKLFSYWKQFDVYAIERMLDEHHNCVIDFGAGHSVYDKDDDLARVKQLLEPFANVVLLLPSPDLDESVRLLRERDKETVGGVDLVEHLVRHDSNYELANHTIITAGKTPDEIHDEILQQVGTPTASIILIGPQQRGKKEIAGKLAATLGWERVALEEQMRTYRQEIGFDEQMVRRRWEASGHEGVYSYFKPFEAHGVERIVADHPQSIIELAPRYSVYEDPELFARVRQALTPYTVVLLLPAIDPDESIAYLHEQQRLMFNGVDVNEFFVKHRSNAELATITVYTKGKTPEETRDEVLQAAQLDHDGIE